MLLVVFKRTTLSINDVKFLNTKNMPIGVPRIIYCWGEELPAQWTDIYNFIFRRRMVFLMQYLDDELCNQICGLLINIHMEDRSKELEKKELERSGVFKSTKDKKLSGGDASQKQSPRVESSYNKKSRSVDDLLNADEDLGIDENDTLEQYTLQKITTEWLNWNAQFFDYSSERGKTGDPQSGEEPYLYYLAELLTKDFKNTEGRLLYNGSGLAGSKNNEISRLMQLLNGTSDSMRFLHSQSKENKLGLDNVYSPFRLLANFASQDYSLNDLNPLSNQSTMKKQLFDILRQSKNSNFKGPAAPKGTPSDNTITNLLTNLAQKDFSEKISTQDALTQYSQKALGQRNLRREYSRDNSFTTSNDKAFNYLNMNDTFTQPGDFELRKSFALGKQTQAKFDEEESKKVFVIINSFGGSVGNGITVHDALQFIKAGSLTLGLGVAASAASLALAGGTIGERYVTEGCHVMIHQPESSLQGQASDIWIDSQEIMKIRLDVAEIYSLSTYRPRHKILRDLDRDFYLTAMETIYYGLADEIATNEVMQEIIEMTSKVWDYHDTKQQRLLESRDSASSGMDTQTQN